MSKDTKLTLETLIAKKEQLDTTKIKIAKVYIKRLDAYITVSKPNIELINDSLGLKTSFESDKHLVSKSIVEPKLNDDELMKAYGCRTAKEVLEKIFEVGEIQSMAQELMAIAGYKDSVTLVDNLKN